MKIKALFVSLILMAGMAFGQSQFSGGGSSTGVATVPITQGYATTGSGASVFASARVLDASAFCLGGYNIATFSCVTGYDNVHGIGHNACAAIIAALAIATPSGTGKVDASAFGSTQYIEPNCGVTLTYAGVTNAPGSSVDGRVQVATNVSFLVDGPATVPFFTDGAVCPTPGCANNGNTAGPSTWGTPGFLLANQFTGIFGGSKDGTQFIPCSTNLVGCTHDWPLRSFPVTSTSVVGNTMTLNITGTLLAGGENGAGANSSAVVTGFTGTSGTLSFTNTGTNNYYAGFNAILFGFPAGADGPLNGQTCSISATGLTATTFQCAVTGSGYSTAAGFSSEANIWPSGGGLTGEYVALVNSSSDDNNALYIAKTVPSSSSITVGVPTGTASCAANCGTIFLFTDMFGWGTQVTNAAYVPQQGGAGLQSFGQRLEDLECFGESTQIPLGKTWPYGFGCMQNVNAGENAGAIHIQGDFIAGIFLDMHGGATDSGPWTDLRMTNLSNLNAVRSTTAYAVAGAIRGIGYSSAITPYPTGTASTSNGPLGACTANCIQVSGTNPATFATVVAGTQMQVPGSGCPVSFGVPTCTVLSVQSNTTATFTSAPGPGGTSFSYGQPRACWLVDGQGPTVNMSPVFIANHPEACADGYRMAANYSVRGTSILGFLGGPSGGHSNVNIVHAVAAGNTITGTNIMGIDTQNGGATNTVLDDINGNTCLDLPLSMYNWDTVGNPTYACRTGTFVTGVQTLGGLIHSFNATKTTAGDSAGITATTAATSTTIFTFTGFSPNVTYKIHCSGTTTQATGGAGIGIAFQTATTAAATELHAVVATGPAATAAQSSGLLTNTGANVVYAGATGTLTTQLPWTIDGSMVSGTTAPSALNIGFYTINAADAVVVKGNSTCDIR